jgi:predicted nucleic acid-binding Zn ribbon protein
VQVMVKPKTIINISDIYAMRRSGATLQQIANKTDRTKERIRQILISNYGSTKHKLMSTEQLHKLSGFSRHLIIKLYQGNVITPVREWSLKNSHHLLWSPATVEQIKAYYDAYKLCKMCHTRIPEGRRVFCSEQCYKEGHKYKYKNTEAKQRQMASVRRYREKCKRLSKSLLIDNSKREKVLV